MTTPHLDDNDNNSFSFLKINFLFGVPGRFSQLSVCLQIRS